MKHRKKLIITLSVVAVLLGVWMFVNPPGRFGWCCYGYSTFNALPKPVADFQVRADGTMRDVAKTHALSFENIEWLLEAKPEVLIIATGWDGYVSPDKKIRALNECDIHILRNKEAIELFNRLKKSGKRVAIHYHSTC